MKKKWLTIGLNAIEIKNINRLIDLDSGNIIRYIHDLHFSHYDPGSLPSGRMPTDFQKADTIYFLKACKENGIATTLLLNYGDYHYEDIKKILDSFYLPNGVSAVVISDINLIRKIKKDFPGISIQGSCISYIDSIEGLLKETKAGVELHNPAVWTIRDMEFIKNIKKHGLQQKQIFSEGCARKCKLEKWHRRESCIGNHHGLNETCRKSIPDIYTFLMGCWITIRQLKRMENDITVLKLPRNTFDDINQLSRFIELYDTDEPYNILEYVSTPLLNIKKDNIIMSDIFDDCFFDMTVGDEIDKEFLDNYVGKMDKIPFFRNNSNKI